MGTPTLTLVGNPPRRGSGALRHWIRYEVPAARIAEIDVARTNNYYFSNSGNDSTGNGTIGNPWATVAKAKTQLATFGSTADAAFWFARGSVFAESGASAGIDCAKNNATFGAYGTGDPPLFHRFTSLFASGWTLGSGDRYYRSVAERPGWVRQTIARLSPYSHQPDLASVEATPRSWTYESGTGRLHINAGAGINPNSPSLAYELSFASTTDDDGIYITGDGCVVKGLRFDGWGCSATDSRQKYGIRFELNGNSAGLAMDCEAYYCGRHAMGLLGQSTNSGGIVMLARCLAGYHYDVAGGGGSNNYVWYQANADFEVLAYDLVSRFGALPQGSVITEGSILASTSPALPAQDIIAHGGTNQKIRLMIVSGGGPTWEPNLTNWTLSSGAVGTGSDHSLGTEGDPDTYRCFIDRYGSRHYQNGRIDLAPRTQYLDCEYRIRFPSTDNAGDIKVAIPISGGLWEGGDMDLEDLRDNQNRAILPQNTGNTTQFDGGTITVNGYTQSGGGTRWRLGQASASFGMAGVTLRNMILSRSGDRSFDVGIGNNASQIISCAHYGVLLAGTDGIDQGTGLVALGAPWGRCAPPSPIGSDLEEAAAASPWSVDILGRTRPRFASIGPVEGRPVQMELATILDRIGPIAGSGNNTLFGFFRALANTDGGLTASELAAVSEGGDYDNTAHSAASLSTGFRLLFVAAAGDACTGTPTTTTVTLASSAPAVANRLVGCSIIWVTGTHAGARGTITAYTSGRLATFEPALPSAPTGGDFYIVMGGTKDLVADSSVTSISNSVGSNASYLLRGGRALYVRPGTVATATIDPSGANNTFTLTAKSAGTDGNAISIALVNPGSANQTLSVSVASAAITVNLATDGASAISSTVNDVCNAIRNKPEAYAMVHANPTSAGNGVVAAVGTTSLSGGTASTGSDSNDGLTPTNAKGSLAGAIAAATDGDTIVLLPGVHKYQSNSLLPRNIRIVGMDPLRSIVRFGGNTLDISTYFKPNDGNVFEDFWVDALVGLNAMFHTGTSVHPTATVVFKNINGECRGYGLWPSMDAAQSGSIQPQHWIAEKCWIRSGIAPWALEGAIASPHTMEARDCTFDADSFYQGSSPTSGTYGVLCVQGRMILHDCHLSGKHTSADYTTGAIQAGAPITPTRGAGIVHVFGGSLFSKHTAHTQPAAITDVSIASQTVITSATHGLSNGNIVRISGIIGTGAALNATGTFIVSDVTTNTFKIKDLISSAYISTSGGTYTRNGQWEKGINWDVVSKFTGSQVWMEGTSYNAWSLEQGNGGRIFSLGLNTHDKIAFLQGGQHVTYASPNTSLASTNPVSHGYYVRDSYTTLDASIAEAKFGSAIYAFPGESGQKFTTTAPTAMKDGVDIHGVGIGRTVVERTDAGGDATSGILSLAAGVQRIEDLTLTDATTSGVSGVVGSGSTAQAAVLDHLRVTSKFDAVRIVASAAGTYTLENTTLRAGRTALEVSGAAHLVHLTGEHPYAKADASLGAGTANVTAIAAANAAEVVLRGPHLEAIHTNSSFTATGVNALTAAKVGFSEGSVSTSNSGSASQAKDIKADGTSTIVLARAASFDPTKTTESGSGVIQTGAEVILQDVVADYTTSGTVGNSIGDAGNAGDPWGVALPGSYADGQAGTILSSLNTKVGSAQITVVSPVATNGSISIVKGDSYFNADARALTFSNNDGTWPTLTGATVSFAATKGTNAALSVSAVVVDGTGTTKSLYVELNSAQTVALEAGTWAYTISATLANSHVVTLVKGNMMVRS